MVFHFLASAFSIGFSLSFRIFARLLLVLSLTWTLPNLATHTSTLCILGVTLFSRCFAGEKLFILVHHRTAIFLDFPTHQGFVRKKLRLLHWGPEYGHFQNPSCHCRPRRLVLLFFDSKPEIRIDSFESIWAPQLRPERPLHGLELGLEFQQSRTFRLRSCHCPTSMNVTVAGCSPQGT